MMTDCGSRTPCFERPTPSPRALLSHNAARWRIVTAYKQQCGGTMAEANNARELPAWIADHLARYIATDGSDGYLWDASVGGGKGMVPTLLLTTVGRKSGNSLTLPLIFGQS